MKTENKELAEELLATEEIPTVKQVIEEELENGEESSN